MSQMNLNGIDLVMEMTRWCNMSCAHCLRGERERKRMSKDTIVATFSQLRGGYVSTFTPTGGEPSLAIDLIEFALDSALLARVRVGNFWMATNGTCTSRGFFKAIERWLEYSCENDISGIRVSADAYHDFLTRETKLRFEDFKRHVQDDLGYRHFYIEYSGAPRDDRYLVDAGRAANWGQKPVTDELRFETNDGELRISEGSLYVGANGWVYPTCDISYELMRDPKWQICRASDNWANALTDWAERQVVDD